MSVGSIPIISCPEWEGTPKREAFNAEIPRPIIAAASRTLNMVFLHDPCKSVLPPTLPQKQLRGVPAPRYNPV